MGGGEAVALTLTDRQRRYLRRALADCKAGREDDLQSHPDHPNAGRWCADADAYGRLIAGVDARQVVPDDRLRRLVRELAEASDREEEYERVVFEHDALAALRDQIGAGQ
ncbi:MAG TPA: hypothetical protein VGI73_13050 [Solirubrobacterales bacterium]|jgi:hypothetical protein